MTSVYEIPHRGHYIILRDEYIQITKTEAAAQLLSLFETWTSAREKEIQRCQSFNKKALDDQKLPEFSLWLYEKISDIRKWLCWRSERTIQRAIAELEELGFIERRSSSNPWDQTREYKLNIPFLIEKLNELYTTTQNTERHFVTVGVTSSRNDGVTSDHPGVTSNRNDRVTSGQGHYINNQFNDQISNDQCKNHFLENEKNDIWIDSKNLDEEEDQVEDVQSDSVVETDIIPNSGHNKNSGSDQFSPDVLHNETTITTKIDNLINYEDAEQCRHELMVIGARESDGQWDEGFLEAVRQHLSRCSHYKGKAKATVHHAQRYCKKHYNCDPSALLAIAQSSLENPTVDEGLTSDVMAAIEAGIRGEF